MSEDVHPLGVGFEVFKTPCHFPVNSLSSHLVVVVSTCKPSATFIELSLLLPCSRSQWPRIHLPCAAVSLQINCCLL